MTAILRAFFSSSRRIAKPGILNVKGDGRAMAYDKTERLAVLIDAENISYCRIGEIIG